MDVIGRFPDLLREAVGEDLRMARDEFATVEAGAPPSVLWRVTETTPESVRFEVECRSQTEQGATSMGGFINSYLDKKFGHLASDMVDESRNRPDLSDSNHVTHFMVLVMPADIPPKL